jgi:mycothiol synthase
MSGGHRIEAFTRLDGSLVADLMRLVDRVTDADGMRPLSEHVWLHLKRGGDQRGLHLVALTADDAVVGYAHLDVTDVVDGPSAEVAVDPAYRRHGLGHDLVEALIGHSADGRLRLWAHGEQAGAAELAGSLGFTRSRVLLQLRRSLYAPLPRPDVPAGIAIRPFRVGTDEDAWLDVNARAFAALQDQGRWTRRDLDLRIAEPWFSADGFLMAWQVGPGADRLVGFHWTKVHGGGHDGHEPIGEVYVVGVDPAAQGLGLGRALTLAGLHHLRSLDLAQAMLYVDSDNTAAIDLYRGLGFAHWDTDVLFRR